MPLGDTCDGILVCQAPVSCVRLTSCVFFLFCIVPNFNILKTCSWHFQCKLGYFGVSIVLQTLTWAGGSLTCVCGPFACVCTRGDLGLQSHLSDFCRVCTEFDSGEISWRLQSLACNSNASIVDCVLTLAFESKCSCHWLSIVTAWSCVMIKTAVGTWKTQLSDVPHITLQWGPGKPSCLMFHI